MKNTICLLLILISLLSYSQTSKVERQIIKSVNNHTKPSEDLLKKAININSGTMNFDGVRKTGELFKSELDKLGFKTQLTSGEAYGRAGHLIATKEGKKGPKFLLIGHLDTVFELDSPFQEYTMLNDSIIKGPGAADMKGGDRSEERRVGKEWRSGW